jgi:uncharacterized membrane protein YidH (DUF202 family)
VSNDGEDQSAYSGLRSPLRRPVYDPPLPARFARGLHLPLHTVTTKMPEDTWLAILIVFFVIPTILLALRIYADTSRYMRSGCLAFSVISLIFAIAAYLFFAIACAMTFYRARRKMRGMDRGPDPSDMGRIPYMAALGQPLREATIVHSYIVTTGLWLCKGSFVAMCRTTSRPRTERALTKRQRLQFETTSQ